MFPRASEAKTPRKQRTTKTLKAARTLVRNRGAVWGVTAVPPIKRGIL
jgi:hypothetical protein